MSCNILNDILIKKFGRDYALLQRWNIISRVVRNYGLGSCITNKEADRRIIGLTCFRHMAFQIRTVPGDVGFTLH